MQKATLAVFTKARAKYGKRLKVNSYHEMTALSSVRDVAGYLKNKTYYSGVLQGVQDSAVHRGNLERLLRQKIQSELCELCRFERVMGEGFFHYLVTKWEIEEIVNFLSYFSAGEPQEFLLTLSSSIDVLSDIDMVSLSSSVSYEDFIARLKGTPYAALLRPFAPESGRPEDIRLPDIEAALKRYRYRSCRESFEKTLPAEVHRELVWLLNMQFELMDIRTIIRSKSFGDWSVDIINSQLTGAKCMIPPDRMKEILLAPTAGASLDLFLQTPYSRYLKRPGISNYRFVDDLCVRILYTAASHKIHYSLYAPILMFCLDICWDVELENVTTIIEGVRYNIHPENIKKLLIFERGGEQLGS